ncbi:MAG: hypothetical protein KGP29_02180 [Proteobacteria bacterium]|nr:hypothetical protein [Pseudomonadota bacterium]
MLDPTLAEKYFDQLYKDVNGYGVSNQARTEAGITEGLLYGELPFATWKAIVMRANPKHDGVFFDLGSGTGRVVLQSHLLFNFQKSVGVELLAGLHDKACDIAEKFAEEIEPLIRKEIGDRELHLFNESFFETDLREADLILLNHPLKDRDLFAKLEQKFLTQLKPGTKIITIIRALADPRFKSLGSEKYTFSWGESTAYFFEV